MWHSRALLPPTPGRAGAQRGALWPGKPEEHSAGYPGGSAPHPAASGTWAERLLCPLPISPFPAADVRVGAPLEENTLRASAELRRRAPGCTKAALFPRNEAVGQRVPPSPAMENPAPSTPLPPLGYQVFVGERNVKFSTSLPASTSALGALAPKAQPPPAPCGDAASLPGPPAPGYTVTCCSGSSSTSRCSTSLPFTLLCQETSVTCSQTTRASGTRTKGQQRGDPRAGCRVGFASLSSPSSGPGRQSAVQGGRRSWFAGEWQQDLTRRARQTGRGRTGAEGTAGDESGFSAPVSPLRKA